jgi:uncharacterized protein (DUF427 family)
MQHPQPEPTAPGEESVWDYPRPPALEPVAERVRVVFEGTPLADSTRALRVLETSHPPVYYLPRDDVDMERLRPAPGSSYCEWKGDARYFDVVGKERVAERVAWSYESPVARFAPLAGYIAFYAGPMDACFVGDEVATPQPGGFYGGWVTSRIKGPIKGTPGSWGW